MKVEKTIILEQGDLEHLHDVILEAINKSLPDKEIIKIWDLILPEDIKLQAEQYGISDTVVRDNIYEFMEKEYGNK